MDLAKLSVTLAQQSQILLKPSREDIEASLLVVADSSPRCNAETKTSRIPIADA